MGLERFHILDEELSRLRRRRYWARRQKHGLWSTLWPVIFQCSLSTISLIHIRLLSTQLYSLFDREPARPPVPPFTIPECYAVHNVAKLDTKMQNLNDEALIYMFYNSPGTLDQAKAAQQLWVTPHEPSRLFFEANYDCQGMRETGATTRSCRFGSPKTLRWCRKRWVMVLNVVTTSFSIFSSGAVSV